MGHRLRLDGERGVSTLLNALRTELEAAALEYYRMTEDRFSAGDTLMAGARLRIAAKAFARQLLLEKVS